MSTNGDLIDRANDRAQQLTDDGVNNVRRLLSRQAQRPSAAECIECGAAIPLARQTALPGVANFVDCATAAEHHNRCGVRA